MNVKIGEGAGYNCLDACAWITRIVMLLCMIITVCGLFVGLLLAFSSCIGEYFPSLLLNFPCFCFCFACLYASLIKIDQWANLTLASTSSSCGDCRPRSESNGI